MVRPGHDPEVERNVEVLQPSTKALKGWGQIEVVQVQKESVLKGSKIPGTYVSK